jgi:hypothetical protein
LCQFSCSCAEAEIPANLCTESNSYDAGGITSSAIHVCKTKSDRFSDFSNSKHFLQSLPFGVGGPWSSKLLLALVRISLPTCFFSSTALASSWSLSFTRHLPHHSVLQSSLNQHYQHSGHHKY